MSIGYDIKYMPNEYLATEFIVHLIILLLTSQPSNKQKKITLIIKH